MIYKALKVLVKLTMFFFFRRRIVKGVENIPKVGPTILVANHPVTFLDPLLVAVSTNIPVHFLAKGIMFKNGLIRAIFKTFNMIPIYRAQDNIGDMSKNEDTFKFCYEHLEKGGLLLIFPEGVSVTDRTIKPLKTGVARIALGAEMRNEFGLGVKIVPFGLTYEGPHQFRKDVLVQAGQPIDLKNYKEANAIDHRQAVHSVMNEIKKSLENLSLNVINPEYTTLVDFILQENALNEIPFDKSVESVQMLFSEITDKSNVEVDLLLEKVNRILDRKKQIGLTNIHLNDKNSNLIKETTLSLLTLILGIPLLLFGFVHNAIPYYLSPVLARKISKDYEYQGPISMTAGMIICLITYPLFFVFMITFSGNILISLIYLVSLPIVGIITYGFFKQLNWLKIQWKVLFLFSRKRDQISELIIERKIFLEDLVSLKLTHALKS